MMAIEEWRAKIEQETDKLVACFVTQHPEYEVDAEQPKERGLAYWNLQYERCDSEMKLLITAH